MVIARSIPLSIVVVGVLFLLNGLGSILDMVLTPLIWGGGRVNLAVLAIPMGAGLLRGSRTAWQCALAYLALNVTCSVVLLIVLLTSLGVPPVVVLGTELSFSKLSLLLCVAVGAICSLLACAALLQPGVRRFIALRAAYFLRWQIYDGIKFLQDVRVFPSLENADDIYLKKDSRLRFALLQSMFTELQWELDYDNTPSSGLDRIDNRFFLNVGWEF